MHWRKGQFQRGPIYVYIYIYYFFERTEGPIILVGERILLFLFPIFTNFKSVFFFFFKKKEKEKKKLAADKHSARFVAHVLLCPQGNVQLPLGSTHFDYSNLYFTPSKQFWISIKMKGYHAL